MAAATVKASSFVSALRVVVVVVIFFAYIVLGTSASSSSSSVRRSRSRSCRWLLPCQILQKGGVAVVRQLTEDANADGADAVAHFSPRPAPPRPRPPRLHQQDGPNLNLHPDPHYPHHYRNDSRSKHQQRRKEKHVINTGQRVGLLFAGVAVLLQVVIVTYLLLKRKRMLDLVNKYECHHVADNDWPPPRF